MAATGDRTDSVCQAGRELDPRGDRAGRGRPQPLRRHAPAARSRCPASGASTSTSRTSRPTRPARSSTGWRARCSSTRCATAGSARARPVIEASSGSTAVSEAYFARMLGPAVHRRDAAPTSAGEDRADRVLRRPLPPGRRSEPRCYDESRRLAAETGGHFMDQFTYAERATDWRGNNNIAESIFEQMAPRARTRCRAGSWSARAPAAPAPPIGRYIRYQRHDTRLCVVDPENSAFFDGWARRRSGAHDRPRLADRGDRPAAGRAVLHAGQSSTG